MPRVGCDTYEAALTLLVVHMRIVIRGRTADSSYHGSGRAGREKGSRPGNRREERGAIGPTADGPVGLLNDGIATNNRIRLEHTLPLHSASGLRD